MLHSFPSEMSDFCCCGMQLLHPTGETARQESPREEVHGRASATQISLPERAGTVTLVAAGAQHSVVATSSGTLWSFGSNEFGQLGLPPSREQGEKRRLTQTR